MVASKSKSKESSAKKIASPGPKKKAVADKDFDPDRKPDGLPYRDIAECYLVYNNKIVAQDEGSYLSNPGGGIDEGETPEEAGKRELVEEIGAQLKGKLEVVSVLEWDWGPNWPDNDKRKKRYMQYRGERVYSLFGVVDKFDKATNADGDAWEGETLMTFKDASDVAKRVYEDCPYPNEYTYNLTKYSIISTMAAMQAQNLVNKKSN
jgi:8-oxo-dGTP pyrophosphatase MutT (NUDIX family)